MFGSVKPVSLYLRSVASLVPHYASRITLFVLCLLVPASGVAQPSLRSPDGLGRAIDAVLADSLFQNAWWTALVTDLSTGETLYRLNEDKSFLPASNAKLYTTAAGLDLLGPDFRYETRVYAGGLVENGVLNGPLIIRGAGDPSLGSYYDPATGERIEPPEADPTQVFRAWADALRTAGITTIDGDIVGDDNVFDDQLLGIGWSWDDEPYWYSAEIGGLVFNDNIVSITVTGRPPGAPGRISWEPAQTTYVSVLNQTRSTSMDARRDVDYARDRDESIITVSGEIPAGEQTEEPIAVANPTLYFAHVLRETLLASGIAVTGRPVDVDALSIKPNYTDLHPVVRHLSPPLSALVKIINKPSQNLYAEQLLKTIGVRFPVPDDDLVAGSTAMGLAAAMPTFVRAHIDTSRFGLVDGSGLSRMNLVTATMTMALLRYMWHHPDPATRQAFLDSLPVGGADGTLDDRLSTAAGTVRAKTGTLTGASALSGYAESETGPPLAFVLMSNGYTVRSSVIRRAQDAIVDLLIRYRP